MFQIFKPKIPRNSYGKDGEHLLCKTIWSNSAKATTHKAKNSMNLKVANFEVANFVWPTNDAINKPNGFGR